MAENDKGFGAFASHTARTPTPRMSPSKSTSTEGVVSRRNLQNTVVAITGGGRGIGLAIARALAERGARVAIGDIDETLAVDAAAPLRGYGGKLDVRDRASFAAFLAASEQALGPVDVLINNAGIMPMGPFDLESDAISDTQIDINLRGVILGCKVALPGML